MKLECPTYLKSTGKTKALAATLNDTEPEADYDESDQDGMVSAFIAIVESLEEAVDLIDEEEELIESKFEKMDDQDDIHTAYTKLYKVSKKHEKLYRLAKRKLSEVDLEHKEHSTKVDEANQTHPFPNCYKWLATQQSNSVSSFGNQNQFQLFLAPLGELF